MVNIDILKSYIDICIKNDQVSDEDSPLALNTEFISGSENNVVILEITPALDINIKNKSYITTFDNKIIYYIKQCYEYDSFTQYQFTLSEIHIGTDRPLIKEDIPSESIYRISRFAKDSFNMIHNIFENDFNYNSNFHFSDGCNGIIKLLKQDFINR